MNILIFVLALLFLAYLINTREGFSTSPGTLVHLHSNRPYYGYGYYRPHFYRPYFYRGLPGPGWRRRRRRRYRHYRPYRPWYRRWWWY